MTRSQRLVLIVVAVIFLFWLSVLAWGALSQSPNDVFNNDSCLIGPVGSCTPHE